MEKTGLIIKNKDQMPTQKIAFYIDHSKLNQDQRGRAPLIKTEGRMNIFKRFTLFFILLAVAAISCGVEPVCAEQAQPQQSRDTSGVFKNKKRLISQKEREAAAERFKASSPAAAAGVEAIRAALTRAAEARIAELNAQNNTAVNNDPQAPAAQNNNTQDNNPAGQINNDIGGTNE